MKFHSVPVPVYYLYGNQAGDELPLVPNEHDISKEGGGHFDAVLNGNRSHVLSPGCDQDLCSRRKSLCLKFNRNFSFQIQRGDQL